MAKSSYKPERPVTSAKISVLLDEQRREKTGGLGRNGNWKRKFKRRLPESRGWVRGYFCYYYSGHHFAGIAISSEDDQKLEKVYILDGTYESAEAAEKAADQECKSLGVLEVMFSDD